MLREGDRVSIRVWTSRVRAGTIGTIHYVFRSFSNTYTVRFDTHPGSYTLFGDMLEPLSDEQGRQQGITLVTGQVRLQRSN